MNDQVFDYGEDSHTPKIGDNMQKALTDAANKHEQLEVEIAKLTAELETKQAALKELGTITIPNIMDGMLGSFQLEDGRVLEINEKVRASIAGDKAAPAVEWLDSNGHAAIVKRQFVIQFNREDESWAKKFEADLRKRKKPLNVVRKHTVHPQTLEAFVREQLGNGVELPKDVFGIYRQKTSKVTHPDPVKTKGKKGGPDF